MLKFLKGGKNTTIDEKKQRNLRSFEYIFHLKTVPFIMLISRRFNEQNKIVMFVYILVRTLHISKPADMVMKILGKK